MSTIAPSSIARTVAGQFWPDVQQQTKLAKGVYEFSCAGHGGFVGIVGAMNVPAAAIEAARECGLIETVVRVNVGRNRHRNYILSQYTAESQANLLSYVKAGMAERIDVWVAEEDCDWATIAAVCPDVRNKLAERVSDIDSHIEHCVTAYNAKFAGLIESARRG